MGMIIGLILYQQTEIIYFTSGNFTPISPEDIQMFPWFGLNLAKKIGIQTLVLAWEFILNG